MIGEGEERVELRGPFVACASLSGRGEERGARHGFAGEFRFGRRHGPGTLEFGCGLVLRGAWRDGRASGTLQARFPDGMEMQCRFDEKGEFEMGFMQDGTEWPAQGDFPGRYPTRKDPYEMRHTIVRKSTVPGAGQGVFALHDLPANFLAVYYNGCLISHEEVDSRSWRYNSNCISLDANFVLDVPNAYASDKQYCATTGHKVNSVTGDNKPNCEYVHAFHPFYGNIKAVRTLVPIKKDQELFTSYAYVNERRPPAWCRE